MKEVFSGIEIAMPDKQRVLEGMETYIEILRTELPPSERPEFQLKERHWNKVY